MSRSAHTPNPFHLRTRRGLCAVAAALALTACGGGGGGGGDNAQAGDPGGQTVATGSSTAGPQGCTNGFSTGTIAWNCTSCTTPENLSAANDGNRATFSRLRLQSLSQSTNAGVTRITYVARAQSGASFPGGTEVGAIVRFPGEPDIATVVGMRTTFAGATIEAFPGNQATEFGHDGQDAKYANQTSLPYSGLELDISINRSALDGAEFRLYELCGGA